jgi:hypothetical protein
VRWLAGIVAAAVIVPIGLKVVGLHPDIADVVLLCLLTGLALLLISLLTGFQRPGWPQPQSSRSEASDDRYSTYLRMLEDNERARTAQSALPERLGQLRSTRDRLRGRTPSIDRAASGPQRMTRQRIAEIIGTIEES